MNKERKGRFNDVINLLEDAKGGAGGHLKRGTGMPMTPYRMGFKCLPEEKKMQEYIDLTDDCIGKINVVIDFVERRL